MIPVDIFSFLEIKISKIRPFLSVCKTKKMELKCHLFFFKAKTVTQVFWGPFKYHTRMDPIGAKSYFKCFFFFFWK